MSRRPRPHDAASWRALEARPAWTRQRLELEGELVLLHSTEQGSLLREAALLALVSVPRLPPAAVLVLALAADRYETPPEGAACESREPRDLDHEYWDAAPEPFHTGATPGACVGIGAGTPWALWLLEAIVEECRIARADGCGPSPLLEACCDRDPSIWGCSGARALAREAARLSPGPDASAVLALVEACTGEAPQARERVEVTRRPGWRRRAEDAQSSAWRLAAARGLACLVSGSPWEAARELDALEAEGAPPCAARGVVRRLLALLEGRPLAEDDAFAADLRELRGEPARALSALIRAGGRAWFVQAVQQGRLKGIDAQRGALRPWLAVLLETLAPEDSP